MQKQIVLFVPENSPEVSEAIETLSKDRTVYLVYFVEKQLMVQEKTRYVHCQEVNGLTIKREKWLRGVYSFVILSVGAPIFVVANQLQNSYLLILTIGVLCLIVCCIPKNGYVCCFLCQ